MTYNVFSGTLNLTQSICYLYKQAHSEKTQFELSVIMLCKPLKDDWFFYSLYAA